MPCIDSLLLTNNNSLNLFYHIDESNEISTNKPIKNLIKCYTEYQTDSIADKAATRNNSRREMAPRFPKLKFRETCKRSDTLLEKAANTVHNDSKRLSLGLNTKPCKNQVTNNLTKEEFHLVHKYAQVLLKPKKSSEDSNQTVLSSNLFSQRSHSKKNCSTELSLCKQASLDVNPVNAGNTSSKIVSSVSSKLTRFKKTVSKEIFFFSKRTKNISRYL